MTRLTLPKNHAQPNREKEPDVLPMDPDEGPVPKLQPDHPNRGGTVDAVAKKERSHATA